MSVERLRYLTLYDLLTGLPNRKLFKKLTEQALTKARYTNQMQAVMTMDVDRFRVVNHSLGDEIGDKALHQFARTVQGCLRTDDIMARQGSDEFAILLPDIEDRDVAMHIAQQILHELQDFQRINESFFQTTPSIGIAFYPIDGTTRHELLTHADEALREVKAQGGNGFRVYDTIRHR